MYNVHYIFKAYNIVICIVIYSIYIMCTLYLTLCTIKYVGTIDKGDTHCLPQWLFCYTCYFKASRSV